VIRVLKASIFHVVTRIAKLKASIPSERADSRQYAIFSTKHCHSSVTLANRMKRPRGVNCVPAIVSLCFHLCQPVSRMTEALKAPTCTNPQIDRPFDCTLVESRGWIPSCGPSLDDLRPLQNPFFQIAHNPGNQCKIAQRVKSGVLAPPIKKDLKGNPNDQFHDIVAEL
jgi:hypothetical protein